MAKGNKGKKGKIPGFNKAKLEASTEEARKKREQERERARAEEKAKQSQPESKLGSSSTQNSPVFSKSPLSSFYLKKQKPLAASSAPAAMGSHLAAASAGHLPNAELQLRAFREQLETIKKLEAKSKEKIALTHTPKDKKEEKERYNAVFKAFLGAIELEISNQHEAAKEEAKSEALDVSALDQRYKDLINLVRFYIQVIAEDTQSKLNQLKKNIGINYEFILDPTSQNKVDRILGRINDNLLQLNKLRAMSPLANESKLNVGWDQDFHNTITTEVAKLSNAVQLYPYILRVQIGVLKNREGGSDKSRVHDDEVMTKLAGYYDTASKYAAVQSGKNYDSFANAGIEHPKDDVLVRLGLQSPSLHKREDKDLLKKFESTIPAYITSYHRMHAEIESLKKDPHLEEIINLIVRYNREINASGSSRISSDEKSQINAFLTANKEKLSTLVTELAATVKSGDEIFAAMGNPNIAKLAVDDTHPQEEFIKGHKYLIDVMASNDPISQLLKTTQSGNALTKYLNNIENEKSSSLAAQSTPEANSTLRRNTSSSSVSDSPYLTGNALRRSPTISSQADLDRLPKEANDNKFGARDIFIRQLAGFADRERASKNDTTNSDALSKLLLLDIKRELNPDSEYFIGPLIKSKNLQRDLVALIAYAETRVNKYHNEVNIDKVKALKALSMNDFINNLTALPTQNGTEQQATLEAMLEAFLTKAVAPKTLKDTLDHNPSLIPNMTMFVEYAKSSSQKNNPKLYPNLLILKLTSLQNKHQEFLKKLAAENSVADAAKNAATEPSSEAAAAAVELEETLSKKLTTPLGVELESTITEEVKKSPAAPDFDFIGEYKKLVSVFQSIKDHFGSELTEATRLIDNNSLSMHIGDIDEVQAHIIYTEQALKSVLREYNDAGAQANNKEKLESLSESIDALSHHVDKTVHLIHEPNIPDENATPSDAGPLPSASAAAEDLTTESSASVSSTSEVEPIEGYATTPIPAGIKPTVERVERRQRKAPSAESPSPVTPVVPLNKIFSANGLRDYVFNLNQEVLRFIRTTGALEYPRATNDIITWIDQLNTLTDITIDSHNNARIVVLSNSNISLADMQKAKGLILQIENGQKEILVSMAKSAPRADSALDLMNLYEEKAAPTSTSIVDPQFPPLPESTPAKTQAKGNWKSKTAEGLLKKVNTFKSKFGTKSVDSKLDEAKKVAPPSLDEAKSQALHPDADKTPDATLEAFKSRRDSAKAPTYNNNYSQRTDTSIKLSRSAEFNVTPATQAPNKDFETTSQQQNLVNEKNVYDFLKEIRVGSRPRQAKAYFANLFKIYISSEKLDSGEFVVVNSLQPHIKKKLMEMINQTNIQSVDKFIADNMNLANIDQLIAIRDEIKQQRVKRSLDTQKFISLVLMVDLSKLDLSTTNQFIDLRHKIEAKPTLEVFLQLDDSQKDIFIHNIEVLRKEARVNYPLVGHPNWLTPYALNQIRNMPSQSSSGAANSTQPQAAANNDTAAKAENERRFIQLVAMRDVIEKALGDRADNDYARLNDAIGHYETKAKIESDGYISSLLTEAETLADKLHTTFVKNNNEAAASDPSLSMNAQAAAAAQVSAPGQQSNSQQFIDLILNFNNTKTKQAVELIRTLEARPTFEAFSALNADQKEAFIKNFAKMRQAISSTYPTHRYPEWLNQKAFNQIRFRPEEINKYPPSAKSGEGPEESRQRREKPEEYVLMPTGMEPDPRQSVPAPESPVVKPTEIEPESRKRVELPEEYVLMPTGMEPDAKPNFEDVSSIDPTALSAKDALAKVADQSQPNPDTIFEQTGVHPDLDGLADLVENAANEANETLTNSSAAPTYFEPPLSDEDIRLEALTNKFGELTTLLRKNKFTEDDLNEVATSYRAVSDKLIFGDIHTSELGQLEDDIIRIERKVKQLIEFKNPTYELTPEQQLYINSIKTNKSHPLAQAVKKAGYSIKQVTEKTFSRIGNAFNRNNNAVTDQLNYALKAVVKLESEISNVEFSDKTEIKSILESIKENINEVSSELKPSDDLDQLGKVIAILSKVERMEQSVALRLDRVRKNSPAPASAASSAPAPQTTPKEAEIAENRILLKSLLSSLHTKLVRINDSSDTAAFANNTLSINQVRNTISQIEERPIAEMNEQTLNNNLTICGTCFDILNQVERELGISSAYNGPTSTTPAPNIPEATLGKAITLNGLVSLLRTKLVEINSNPNTEVLKKYGADIESTRATLAKLANQNISSMSDKELDKKLEKCAQHLDSLNAMQRELEIGSRLVRDDAASMGVSAAGVSAAGVSAAGVSAAGVSAAGNIHDNIEPALLENNKILRDMVDELVNELIDIKKALAADLSESEMLSHSEYIGINSLLKELEDLLDTFQEIVPAENASASEYEQFTSAISTTDINSALNTIYNKFNDLYNDISQLNQSVPLENSSKIVFEKTAIAYQNYFTRIFDDYSKFVDSLDDEFYLAHIDEINIIQEGLLKLHSMIEHGDLYPHQTTLLSGINYGFQNINESINRQKEEFAPLQVEFAAQQKKLAKPAASSASQAKPTSRRLGKLQDAIISAANKIDEIKRSINTTYSDFKRKTVNTVDSAPSAASPSSASHAAPSAAASAASSAAASAASSAAASAASSAISASTIKQQMIVELGGLQAMLQSTMLKKHLVTNITDNEKLNDFRAEANNQFLVIQSAIDEFTGDTSTFDNEIAVARNILSDMQSILPKTQNISDLISPQHAASAPAPSASATSPSAAAAASSNIKETGSRIGSVFGAVKRAGEVFAGRLRGMRNQSRDTPRSLDIEMDVIENKSSIPAAAAVPPAPPTPPGSDHSSDSDSLSMSSRSSSTSSSSSSSNSSDDLSDDSMHLAMETPLEQMKPPHVSAAGGTGSAGAGEAAPSNDDPDNFGLNDLFGSSDIDNVNSGLSKKHGEPPVIDPLSLNEKPERKDNKELNNEKGFAPELSAEEKMQIIGLINNRGLDAYLATAKHVARQAMLAANSVQGDKRLAQMQTLSEKLKFNLNVYLENLNNSTSVSNEARRIKIEKVNVLLGEAIGFTHTKNVAYFHADAIIIDNDKTSILKALKDIGVAAMSNGGLSSSLAIKTTDDFSGKARLLTHVYDINNKNDRGTTPVRVAAVQRTLNKQFVTDIHVDPRSIAKLSDEQVADYAVKLIEAHRAGNTSSEDRINLNMGMDARLANFAADYCALKGYRYTNHVTNVKPSQESISTFENYLDTKRKDVFGNAKALGTHSEKRLNEQEIKDIMDGPPHHRPK